MRPISAIAVLGLVACGGKKPVEPAASEAPSTTAPAPAPAPVMDVDKMIEKAITKIESGDRADLNDAAASLKQALSLQPDRLDAQLNLGVALHELGDLSAARVQYSNVNAADPTISEAWLYLGAVQEKQGDVGGAVSTYRQGLGHDPEAMPMHVALIGALRKQGKIDDAIAASKVALATNSNTVDVYNNFGLVYMDQGNMTLARFIFQKALQSVPEAEKNAYIHCNLGWVSYQDGDPVTATAELKKAVALDPELVPALVYLSRIYMDDKNYGDTVPLLETAASVTPDNPNVQLTLGVAYRGVGRLDDAEKAYRKALQLDPSDPSPNFNLGVLLGDFKKDYDGAVSAFNTYVQAGGPESVLAAEYIKDIEKERSRAAKRTKAAGEKAKRDAERAEKQRLIDEAEKKEKEAAEQPPAPAPEVAPAPAPEEAPAPAPEVAPAPSPEEEAPSEAPAPAEMPTEAPAEPAPAPEEGSP